MSLESPTIIEKGLAIVKAYRIWFIISGLFILLVLVWGLFQWGSDVSRDRKTEKLKANADLAINEVTNLKAQAANIEDKRIEANANVNAAVADYQRETFGREQDKAETNAALANFQKALNANANVDRTAEDLQRKLQELDGK